MYVSFLAFSRLYKMRIKFLMSSKGQIWSWSGGAVFSEIEFLERQLAVTLLILVSLSLCGSQLSFPKLNSIKDGLMSSQWSCKNRRGVRNLVGGLIEGNEWPFPQNIPNHSQNIFQILPKKSPLKLWRGQIFQLAALYHCLSHCNHILGFLFLSLNESFANWKNYFFLKVFRLSTSNCY